VEVARHLLVDGSNILHAWPELSALLKRDRDAARSQLVQQLAAIHDAESVQLTIVFDGRGDKLVIEHPSRQSSLTVIYTASSQTADDVIEQMAAKAVATSRCLVATDDRAEQQTVRAAGAEVVSSSDLVAWAKQAGVRISSLVKRRQSANEKTWRQ
jgi:predicted RNA-binding protein with PIN domain